MDREKSPLKPALKDLAERERRNLGPHPTPEQLADYHAEKLSAQDEEAIRDHLALCPECAELYLDLVEFASPEPARDVSGLTDEDVDAAWQDMRARLSGAAPVAKPPEAPPAAEARVPRPVPEPPPEPRQAPAVPVAPAVVPLQRPERVRPSRVYQSLAAMFLLTTLGAGFWAVSLQRQLREPQVVTATLPLEPGGSTTRGGGDEPTTQDRTQVTLYLRDMGDSSRYRVDLLDESGKVVWSKVMPPVDDTLRFILPDRSLDSGDYLFRVHRLDPKGAGAGTDFPFSFIQ